MFKKKKKGSKKAQSKKTVVKEEVKTEEVKTETPEIIDDGLTTVKGKKTFTLWWNKDGAAIAARGVSIKTMIMKTLSAAPEDNGSYSDFIQSIKDDEDLKLKAENMRDLAKAAWVFNSPAK